MLIDVEKYVRQYFPPNKRGNENIGLITTLFKPIDGVINAQNEFVHFSQFIAQGGQVGVLEFVLQNYVHPNIRVLDADGVRLDFRVMIPEGLAVADIGKARALIELLRPGSKRYEIADVPDWSNGSGTVGLAWEIAPQVVSGTEIRFMLNQGGEFRVRIYRLDQQQLYIDQIAEYPAGFAPRFILPSAGVWRVEVGPLFATVDLTPVTVTPFAPNWLLALLISFSANNRECSLFADTLDNVDTELRIESTDGSVVTGWTWGNVPFSSATYIPGTTIWANGHSEVFRLNTQGGAGGLQPGTDYRIYIRRTAAPNEVFTMVITTPATTVDPATSIPLPSGGTGEACDRAPTVTSIIAAKQAHIAFYFDAENVTLLKTHLKDVSTGTITRTGMVTPSDNHPTWTFTTPVAPGEYQLGVEGGNCSSLIDWSDAFIIEEEDEVDPGGPLDPQSGDWAVFQQIVPFPGHMKLQRIATATGWLYTDLVTKSGLGVPSDHNGWYVINGKRVVTDRLVDYPVDIPIQVISIRKSFQKPGITDWWQVEHVLGGNYGDQYVMQPGNVYSAMAADVFIKQ